ncbi:MAG: hypothetical protein ACREQ5_00860 [Candidatus Dormibacteria bacterium]
MTTQLPTHYTPPPTQTTPLQYLDVTGVQEDVLWAVGRAQRLGQLARVDPAHHNDDGTVTVRIYHTGPAHTRHMPTPPGAEVDPPRWDSWDYFSAGLLITRYLFVGGVVCVVLWRIGVAVSGIGAWFGANGATIIGVVGAIALVMLLLALLGRRGRGCPGVISHCFGCRN